jgi:hypothetical protein
MASKPSKVRATRTKPTPRRRPAKPAAPAIHPKRAKPNAAPKTKLDAIVAALSAPKGATLEVLMAATGWQAHSVRGAISGAIKKQRGLAIASTKVDGVQTYRIAGRS